MTDISRRRLFGLFAGAAAAPMLPAAAPVPWVYGWNRMGMVTARGFMPDTMLISLERWNEIRAFFWEAGTFAGDGLDLINDDVRMAE